MSEPEAFCEQYLRSKGMNAMAEPEDQLAISMERCTRFLRELGKMLILDGDRIAIKNPNESSIWAQAATAEAALILALVLNRIRQDGIKTIPPGGGPPP